MAFNLNSQNVFDYLVQQGLYSSSNNYPSDIQPILAKNFNLLLTFPDGHKLLVKQERINQEGKTAGEFLAEWGVHELLHKLPNYDYLSQFLPEVLNFDAENSIIVLKYLDDYQDLMEFYTKENIFPLEIAAAIGHLLGMIHRDTFNRQEYAEFLSEKSDNLKVNQVSFLIQRLERVEPEVFGLIPGDGLRFFALYQRYDSLGQAIASLGNAITPSCLTHNDLKLNNILLYKDWQNSNNNPIRLIDWERSAWGDPAFDLGTLISSYLQLWLGRLVISTSLSIEESLRLAITPLEFLQPSIAALTKAYLQTFPEILEHRPDFLLRIVQFSGLALIQQIQAMIQYQKSFGNTGIAMLQVAKTLLCRPEASIPTVFGTTIDNLIKSNVTV
ncbi:MAG TPA: aminoglycoside phosphotransferase family protein [Nostocaceae cyanobacterium]|nr:aminoglycoside phosphotransferase family protein [Nostocaceae cyanobacterium]